MAQHKSAEATITTDHDTIRTWAEARGGKPATVKGTHRKDEVGILRVMFPDAPHAADDKLDEIGWDEFFEKFEDAKLAFLYEETTADGQKSLFNKLIGRETAEAREHGATHGARHHR